jgi:hypothetical protein
MKIEEKYRLLGEAIMREYYSHGAKEIVVTITDESVLEYLHVCVDVHPSSIVSFTEREQEEMRKCI